LKTKVESMWSFRKGGRGDVKMEYMEGWFDCLATIYAYWLCGHSFACAVKYAMRGFDKEEIKRRAEIIKKDIEME